jgi:hypothetical protein
MLPQDFSLDDRCVVRQSLVFSQPRRLALGIEATTHHEIEISTALLFRIKVLWVVVMSSMVIVCLKHVELITCNYVQKPRRAEPPTAGCHIT